MEFFFILLRQFRGERHKILLSQPHHQKGSGNDIVHQPVLVPQGTVQRHTHELCVIVIDDGDRVISKGVACADGAAHSLLQGFQVVIDLDLLRILSRCNFQHRQSVLVLFHYLPPRI